MGLCLVVPNPSPFLVGGPVGGKGGRQNIRNEGGQRGLGVRRFESCALPQINPATNQMFAFAPFEEGEGLGERRGSLDERHRERVRSVDQSVEEWEGT
jgi:hypothetical protein